MYSFIFIINVLFCAIALHAEVGYFCVPVADLIAEPFNFSSKERVKEAYDSISVSPEQGKRSCLRVHQGIFNESFSIVSYKNDQVQIVLKNCSDKSMMGLYEEPVVVWTLKEWIITQDELDHLNNDQLLFPLAFDENSRCNESIITLIFPWYDEVTDLTYSAGTRFCLDSTQSSNDYYAIHLYDRIQKRSVASYIPKTYVQSSGSFTSLERRKLFVNLLYTWCNDEESIPFVWGGTSFTNSSHEKIVLKKWFNNDGQMLAWWDCPSCTTRPFSGLDASGLLLRAAQICGIPYYCCNSRTVANTLPMIAYSEMQEGDILWAPGYVGVIASLYNNEIIEAQGYARGYGVIHCISLKNRFEDIQTWDDFVYCCENKIPLKSLDSQGRCVAHVPTFKIYRLPC